MRTPPRPVARGARARLAGAAERVGAGVAALARAAGFRAGSADSLPALDALAEDFVRDLGDGFFSSIELALGGLSGDVLHVVVRGLHDLFVPELAVLHQVLEHDLHADRDPVFV